MHQFLVAKKLLQLELDVLELHFGFGSQIDEIIYLRESDLFIYLIYLILDDGFFTNTTMRAFKRKEDRHMYQGDHHNT